MLSDNEFIENSLISNLYYLRTLREFCARVELSLPSFYTDYINKANDLAKRCENLGTLIVNNYANNNIPSVALNSSIFVTKYTITLEELTNKLFNYNMNTSITKNELNLKPGIPTSTKNLIEGLERGNNEALESANEFISFSEELSTNINNQDCFCFYYNSLNTNTVYEMNVYTLVLERLINRNNLDPLYVVDYEYGFNKLMSSIATYIRGECDPFYPDIVKEANDFYLEYSNLINEYENTTITPENQGNMTNNSIELAKRFKIFIETCIEKLIRKEIYFTTPPITKDNALTDVNYFIYNLEQNIKEL